LDPILDAEKYWNFSFMEMGLYDLEAEITFIKIITSVEKITLLGYGHGNT
jgi:hypothetical protein